MIDFWSTLYFLGTCFILLLTHRWFIRPYLLLKPYRKLKGVKVVIRSRLLPDMAHQHKDAVEKGDYYYKWKQAITENPDLRAMVTVNGPLFNIHLFDPELIKEFLKQPEVYEKRLG